MKELRIENIPIKINGAELTTIITTGCEVVCSEGNYEAAFLDIKIRYNKTAEELKALADQGDMSWCTVEGVQGWEDAQIRLFEITQGNLVFLIENADDINASTAREFVATTQEIYQDESTIFYHASYDRSTGKISLSAGGDEDTDHMINKEEVESHVIIITKESLKKEQL
jgi:hypothetical protein|nr:MAG TPA: hypothetical protein [Crassvirales sp.]